MAEDPVLWLGALYPQLMSRERHMRTLDDYYSGIHPLPFLTEAHNAKMQNEFRKMLEESKSNFMRLVVDAVEERMRVEGFRLSAGSSQQSDEDTWQIWQENGMDGESSVAILESLVKGVSYLSVWGDGEKATIAVEDPTQTIVGYVPGSNYRKRAAALKVWVDENGDVRANVYTAEGITKFVSSDGATAPSPAIVTDTADETTFEGSKTVGGSVRVDVAQQSDTPRWVELTSDFVANPHGVVPIVPLRNRPRLLHEGESEISDVVAIQNQINGFNFLLALAGYFGAHKQRWAVGVSIALNPTTKKPMELLSGADTLWQNENPNAKFGEFSQTDLAPYISAIEQKVLHIAVTTRTPRHYLIQEGQSPSGDAIKSAESGLTKKVERKFRTLGEGFEEALRIARKFSGLGDSPSDSEVVWGDPTTRSDGEIVDAAVKKVQLGLIDRWQALEDIGYTQTQIERMRNEPAPVPPTAPTPVGPTPPEGDEE